MNKASLIKESGLKVTKNRESVLDFLIKESKPLTAEDVSKKLKINIVTTYRILESFVSKGLIYQTDFREGKSFFEYQDEKNHHHHITCSKCGFREHLDVCIGDELLKKIKEQTSFKRIDSHVLEFLEFVVSVIINI